MLTRKLKLKNGNVKLSMWEQKSPFTNRIRTICQDQDGNDAFAMVEDENLHNRDQRKIEQAINEMQEEMSQAVAA